MVAQVEKPAQVDKSIASTDVQTKHYSDVLVIQGELELQVGRKDSVINPLVIIEVLSQSTAEYDRQEKFWAYRTIPTFHEYLLIDQLQSAC
jgi:Uma2 family endonuclease